MRDLCVIVDHCTNALVVVVVTSTSIKLYILNQLTNGFGSARIENCGLLRWKMKRVSPWTGYSTAATRTPSKPLTSPVPKIDPVTKLKSVKPTIATHPIDTWPDKITR